jgi:hypothetical protein
MATAANAIPQDPKQDYTAVDPRKDPIAFVMQNKEALQRMPEDKAVKFVDMMFRRYTLPKYQQVNKQMPLDEEEISNLRLQFAARMFGLPSDPTDLKGPGVKYGAASKTAATVEGAGAGVLGGVKTIAELAEKLNKHLGVVGKPSAYVWGKVAEASGKQEGKAYEDARTVAPTGASVGAAVGHQIPSSIIASGAGKLVPVLAGGRAAPLGMRILEGGARGAVEGAAYGGTTPGGDAEGMAKWGGILGMAFPMLGRIFGLGRKTAPEVAKAVEGRAGTSTAEATSEKATSLGDVANKAAKEKFGKSFNDLTPAEKAQMPQVMKEAIAKQRAQQAATKKAEVAAAKAGREAEETAKREAKAKAASEKAAQQAAKRSVTGATTSTAKQAVAAQAAAENPSAAKMMGATQGGEDELERARRGGGKEIPLTKEQIEAEEKRKALAEAEKNLKIPGVTKVPEGVEGKKIRAKAGQPASPAQQAADRERIAKKREAAKTQEFGAALEKHAQELAGKYTPGSLSMMHIPELEEAMKEFPNGELFLRGFQKLRKAGLLTDEIYFHEMKQWLEDQLASKGAA